MNKSRPVTVGKSSTSTERRRPKAVAPARPITVWRAKTVAVTGRERREGGR